MEKAYFDKEGGEISVEIKSVLQPGSYTYYLWEANSNHYIEKKRGNFLNDNDDKYTLPVPNEINNERYIEFLTTLVITPPIKNYHIDVTVYQDGKVIGKDFTEGTQSKGTVTSLIYLQLLSEKSEA